MSRSIGRAAVWAWSPKRQLAEFVTALKEQRDAIRQWDANRNHLVQVVFNLVPLSNGHGDQSSGTEWVGARLRPCRHRQHGADDPQNRRASVSPSTTTSSTRPT